MGKIKMIAAVGKNLELGKDNDLIWKIKQDMKFFKEQTMNQYVLMGYNTYLSLPKKLIGRKYIVLTSKDKGLFPNDVMVVNSLDEFYCLKSQINDDVFVIGGSTVYKLMLPDTDEIYLTEIDDSCYEADVYFPKFKDSDYEKVLIDENLDNDPSYRHVLYKKKT